MRVLCAIRLVATHSGVTICLRQCVFQVDELATSWEGQNQAPILERTSDVRVHRDLAQCRPLRCGPGVLTSMLVVWHVAFMQLVRAVRSGTL